MIKSIYKLYKQTSRIYSFSKLAFSSNPYTQKLIASYLSDIKRANKFMHIGSASNEKLSENHILTFINIWYHSLEKGLSVENPRLGFGYSKIKELAALLKQYHDIHGNLSDHDIIVSAVSALKNYLELHEANNFKIDAEVRIMIDNTLSLGKSVTLRQSAKPYQLPPGKRLQITLIDAIRKRQSIRNYDCQKNIKKEDLSAALSLSVHCPTACNRQAYRVHHFCDQDRIKELLALQGGTAGFNCVPGLLSVTYKRSFYHNAMERNSGFIDGGIFLMNLIYSLLLYGFDSCILNNAFDNQKDMKMRYLMKDVLDEDEEFIAFIAFGYSSKSGLSPFSSKNQTSYEF